jgi:protein-disulfide isomerase
MAKDKKKGAFTGTSKTTPTAGSTSAKASQREALRALQAREAQEKRVRTWITYGIVAAVVVALVVGLMFLVPTLTAKNNQAASSDPYSVVIGNASAPVTIDIYQDYMCPYCGELERAQSADMKVLTDSGTAKIVFHVMAFLDDSSNGTKYSTRAANAFVVVAQKEPDKALAFNAALFTDQPKEGSDGLSDAEIAARATKAGVSEALAATFASLSQADFVKKSNDASFAAGIQSTPTIKINGTVLSRNLYTSGSLRAAAEKAASGK